MASKITKSNRRWCIAFFILSVLLNVVPELVGCICAFTNSGTQDRIAPLIIALAAAAILSIITWLAKIKIRSAGWVVFLGMYYVFCNIPSALVGILLAIAICTIVDDVVITPLYRHFRFNWKTNGQIDKRIGDGGE